MMLIEYILKHYISEHCKDSNNSDILKSHKLIMLANKSNIPELLKYDSTLRTLTSFYYDGRYPCIDYYEPTLEDLESVVSDVKEIFQIIEKTLL